MDYKIVEQFLFSKFHHGINVNTYKGEGEGEEAESKEHIPFRTKERYQQLINFKKKRNQKENLPDIMILIFY